MSDNWTKVNQALVAKAIGELTFEQLLLPTFKDEEWTLQLKSGVSYTFKGWMTVWEHLRVDPDSLKRDGVSVSSAARFFIDSKSETEMSDITLGQFLEEMHNTLHQDLILLEKNSQMSASLMTGLKDVEIQGFLNGHPKILLNKGRIGWDKKSLEDYAPESGKSFQLVWLAVKKDLIQGIVPGYEILDESFKDDEKEIFLSNSKYLDGYYVYMPVHPWQWDRYISIQYVGLLEKKQIIYLGQHGDLYRPQISLRTLSNISRPEKKDIKVPLSILNTSSIRGLPAKTISQGPEISQILSRICEQDSFLKDADTQVLKESYGMALIHPDYDDIKNAPYRYHEFLGVVWRESTTSKLKEDEKTILAAALLHQDQQKKSLIGEFVRLSQITYEEWLKRYFEVVILPLYHLQINYGVGLVAHGQNIVVKLKNNIPTGILLKDFQGDMRLLSEECPELQKHFSSISEGVIKLPPHYLIHDLITGHFITVLRFLSGVLEESDNFKEKDFYKILAKVIAEYVSGKKISKSQNLFSKTISRVLLNKVRFNIGYSESSERPLPLLGRDLRNPLVHQDSI